MSVLSNDQLMMTDDGYNIQRSLRFRSSASAYLNRTPASSTNQTTWTWSGWVKRGTLGVEQHLFGCGTAGTNNFQFFFSSTDNLQVNAYIGGTTVVVRQTNALFRDPSAWYHVVLIADTNNATQANRMLMYVNGVTQSFATSYALTSGQTFFINTNIAHYSGKYWNTGGYFDGYLAEVNFIDGQALTPSSFGQTDAVTGVWVPKKYAGTYGTNGFYLPFSDNTSATTLAYDKSGNGNNWTANNISTTAGATYDSMTDVPTMAELSGNGNSNYAVLNPLDKGTGATTSNGNLRLVTTEGSPNSQIRATMPILTKSYCEFTLTAKTSTGSAFGPAVVNMDTTMATSDTLSGSYQITWVSNGIVYNPASNSGYSTFAAGDILGVAYDPSTKTVWFAKNNVWITGNPSTGSGGFTSTDLTSFGSTQTFSWYDGTSASAQTVDANFGQRPFSYTPPTGFKALNTFNLPDPTIKKPNQYMDATLYTGTSASGNNVVNAAGFQPDLVWLKNRNYGAGTNHVLVDAVRGASNGLASNLTNGDFSTAGNFTSINSNGFTIQGTAHDYNYTGDSFVGWQWKESATAGFDIVTYAGTGANRTVSHSLGVAPSMMIVKDRSGANVWCVYHQNANASPATGLLQLNSTNAFAAGSTIWNNTAPTSSVFTVGTDTALNGSGKNYVAYLFAEIPGYSKFGSYTGNGSADGPFVYCGFRPKYVLIKVSSGTADDWYILDSARNTYNATNPNYALYADLSNAEANYSAGFLDFTSNGFKLRSAGAGSNASGSTYIYAAFAENPFKYSNAR